MPLGTDATPDDGGRAGLPERIAAELVARARREGLETGAHLPEQALAEAFRVSRTPVRQALELLEARGVVERRRNRGFFLRELPPQSTSAAQAADTAPTDASEDPLYMRIAEDHLAGLLEVRVTESELARRYGVAGARLQRLLFRMAREGWVERLPGHGWEFQAVLRSPEAYEQGFRFRALIEPAALLEPGYRLDPAVAARLRAEQEAMLAGGWRTFPKRETHRIGAEFHEALVAGSGNPFLVESIRRVNRMRRLIDYRTHDDRSRLERTCRDHLRILDMVEAGDREGASAFLKAHLWQEMREKVPLSAPPGEAPTIALDKLLK